MNQLDALLLILLVPFALRGWWRGFGRESLGLAGLFAGALAAAAAGPVLAKMLGDAHLVPPAFALPVAWGAIFVAAWAVAAILGAVADRVVRAMLLGGVNRLAGAAFGAAKGAVVLGFGLLVAEHSLPSTSLRTVVARSRLGRPLEQLAGSVVERGRGLRPAPAEHAA